MYEDTAIDDTLGRLDEAVDILTSSSSIDALKRIVRLAHAPAPAREVAEQASSISNLCSDAHGALLQGLDAIEEDRDEDAAECLDRALHHLHTVAGLVDVEEPAHAPIRAAELSLAD
jgi:hypothetical protein